MLLSRVRKRCSLPFMLAVVMVYMNQGFKGIASLSIQRQMKDVLLLSPAAAQALQTTAGLPWSIKPLFGMLSDFFPLFSMRRKPYLLAASVLGTVAWMALALSARSVLPGELPEGYTAYIGALMFCSALSGAMSDVVVDAMVAERTNNVPELEADLQMLCWGSLAVGGIVGSTLGSFVFVDANAHTVFFVTSSLQAAVAVGAVFVEEIPRGAGVHESISDLLRALWEAVTLPTIYLPMGWIFLARACSPSFAGPMYFFMTDELGFTNEALSAMSVVMWFAMLSVTMAYKKMFADVSTPSLFFWGQFGRALCVLPSLALVLRWNTLLGIPDGAFCLMGDVLDTIATRIFIMRFLIMATRLTPSGVEATLFSAFMSLSNFSRVVGSYGGIALTSWMGIGKGSYENLATGLAVQFAVMLIPMMFVDMVRTVDDQAAVELEEVDMPTKAK